MPGPPPAPFVGEPGTPAVPLGVATGKPVFGSVATGEPVFGSVATGKPVFGSVADGFTLPGAGRPSESVPLQATNAAKPNGARESARRATRVPRARTEHDGLSLVHLMS